MLRTKIRILSVVTLVMLLSIGSFNVYAAGDSGPRKITGVVLDNSGIPVVGANVVLEGSKNFGTMTDIDGRFSIEVPGSRRLLISCIGFENQKISLKPTQSNYSIILSENATLLDDVVVVGYGVQKKESVVGAISQVQGESLVNSGISNITNAISGKLSGVTTLQSSGQPGQNDAEIIIRGVSSFNNSSPLVLVDGVERDFASIDPNEVENISVLKDASATAVFGAKGANGVIIVTTKSGKEGKPTMNISVSQGFAKPINTPSHVDGYQTMSLLNVARMNDQQFEGLSSQQVLKEYQHPSTRLNALRYPDVDWFKEMTKPFASTTNANFNISGGTKFVKYFASVGYVHEGSIFKSFHDDKVDSGYKYDRFNFRTNVDFNVTRTTKVSFKLGGNVGIKNKPQPQGGDDQMWLAVFGASTTKYPMYYPSWVLKEVPDLDYPNSSEDRLLSEADQSVYNPYYQMMKGSFIQLTDNKLFSDLIINQKLDFITRGLSVQGKVSLSTYYKYSTLRTEYNRPSYVLDFNKVGTDANPWRRTGDDGYVFTQAPIYTNAGNELQGGYYLDLYYDLSLNYNRSFGNHNVTGLFLFNRQEQDKGSSFPYYNEALVARATYDYSHKYLLEFNMGYTGSERFAPSNRFGFFPSGAVGWVVTQEKFMEPLKPYLSKLKFRFSMGLVGSDYANNRWLYISEYSKDSNGHIVEDKAANLSAQWEQAFKKDLGIEMGFFNNDLTVNVDLFDEYRDKMLISVNNNTPIWLGTSSKELNKGAIKKHGIEVEVDYNKKIAKDWIIRAGGNFSFNENRIVYTDDAPFALNHQRAVGAPIGTPVNGVYLADGGFLTSIDDIHSSFLPLTMDKLVIGDYKYLDYTGDGVIDKDDLGRIKGSLYPPISFAFNAGFSWKGLDFNMLFQGYSGKWVNFNQIYEYEFYKGNYSTHKSSLDYWSPANPKGNHAAVHYSASQIPNMQWTGYSESITSGGYGKIAGKSWRKSDYVRLKEATLSYTWKGEKFRKRTGMQALKAYVTGNNLLTFTDLLEGDPEGKYLVWGSYPYMRTVKLGLQFTF